MATVALRRRGVFVRTADLWARIGRVRKLVFDKTGTLTLETPRLLNPEALRSLAPEAREALHVLVSENPHPISQCLLENLMSLSDTKATLPAHGTEPEEFVGQGVTWTSNGNRWSLGRPGWRGQPDSSGSPETHEDRGVGAEFACDGTALACFHFSDTARPDATAELAALHSRGFATYILSGDRQQKVSSLAHELDLAAAHAVGDLTPQQKAIWLEAHGRDDVLMLGDGANDSLAFDRALCRGTPVIHRGVLEQKADFYYLGQGIGGLRALFDVNGVRRRTQTTVTIFSIAYNALAVGMAVVGHMNPLVAAIMMPLNSLITLALVSGGMRGAFKR
jgi:Cu2+-exporting ATPase